MDLLAVPRHDELVHRVQHPVAPHHVPLLGVVQVGQRDVLLGDVGPGVEFGPVREREHPDALPGVHPAVVEVPQLGPLVLGVPLAEVVAEREHPLLGAGLLLVPPGAAEEGVEPVQLGGLQQHRGLDPVPGAVGFLTHRAALDRVGDGGDDELHLELFQPPVPEGDHLGEVQAGVDVHERERDAGRRERLAGQHAHHHGVLAAREQQAGPLHLGRHLPDDVDALGLQGAELAQHVAVHRPPSIWATAASRRGACSGRVTTRSGSQGLELL